MPRIRKKTSKRGTTHHRARIHAKVRESHKKSKKEAKKNVQWKSKHKKDPGIPNNFPYKDQILAEIAEERRLAAEEKQKRKEEKKAAKAQPVDVEDVGSVERDDQTYDGVSNVRAQTMSSKAKGKVVPNDDSEDHSDVPVLLNRDLPNLSSVVDKADVVLHILDARDPLSFCVDHLERLVKQRSKKMVFILNKIDTCPREVVSAWLSTLRCRYPTFPFRSASAFLPAASGPTIQGKGKGKEPADNAMGVDTILAYLEEFSMQKGESEALVVAVVGLTNSGKSSFVNSLLRKSALVIYTLTSSLPGPTTTTSPQEVTLEIAGKQIRLIDTPGLWWKHDTNEPDSERAARDVLLFNRGHIERLKDPAHAISEIVKRANSEDLMLLYNLPAFTKCDSNAFLATVARANNYIKKHGVLDLIAASRLVLRDWRQGKFPWYAPPNTSTSPTTSAGDDSLSDLYSKDESVLSKLRTKKDTRKDTGLVKFVSGCIDSRHIAPDEPWNGMYRDKDERSSQEDEGDDSAGTGDEDDDDDDAEGEDESGTGDEDDNADTESEDDDDDEQDEDEPLPPPRKRKVAPGKPLPPRKKVSFSAEPKSPKSSRPVNVKGPASKKHVKASPQKMGAAVVQKSVANSGPKRKPVPNAKADGEEPYDFSKFFRAN